MSAVVHPNPFNTFPVLSIPDVAAGTTGVITVYNISGKMESKRDVALDKGNNTVALEEMINMKGGVYFLTITIGSETSVQRVIKF